MSWKESYQAKQWADTDALYLHVAMCLLGGEWRSCKHCRPMAEALWPAVERHIKLRARREKRRSHSAQRTPPPSP